MILEYNQSIINQIDLAKVEEKISKQKAKQLLDSQVLALTDQINDRALFMKGIDVSYYYEGYSYNKSEEL